MAKKKKAVKQYELEFEGFERQLYCWIRQQRYLCAIHKSLYYDIDSAILDDYQYDKLEKSLIVVESRHLEISQAVNAEGYQSPSDYVGSTRLPSVLARAEQVLEHFRASGMSKLPFAQRDINDTDDDLYEDAIRRVKQYPT